MTRGWMDTASQRTRTTRHSPGVIEPRDERKSRGREAPGASIQRFDQYVTVADRMNRRGGA